MARQKEKGDRKPYAVYATAEQIEYLRWWLKNRGEVPPAEKWKGAKPE